MMKDLIDVFRPLRWYRNGFMLLAVLLAVKILDIKFINFFSYGLHYRVILSFIALCLVTSGNYGINEVVDAKTDRYHPQKKKRSIPSEKISAKVVIILSLFFYITGFLIISRLNNYMLSFSLFLLAVSAFLYNIKPLRIKDIPYIDFIFEALNNPIRLMVGWYTIATPNHLAPASLILGFWFLGIFLMAAKRFGEIRFIHNRKKATQYRLSFKYYKEEHLLFSMIAALVSFSFMLGAMSFKYSVDLMIELPFIIVWTIWFFHLTYQKNTIVKDPERIFEKIPFLTFSLATLLLFAYLFYSGNQIFGWFLRK